jgi:RNase adapter protein RapZ
MNPITLVSFGFKYGLPHANYYFDVGFLKNPAREKKWDFFSNSDEEMIGYIMNQEQTKELMKRIVPLIVFLAGLDQNQIFAFGCSAGRHRSSIFVQELAKILEKEGIKVHVKHRDLE